MAPRRTAAAAVRRMDADSLKGRSESQSGILEDVFHCRIAVGAGKTPKGMEGAEQ